MDKNAMVTGVVDREFVEFAPATNAREFAVEWTAPRYQASSGGKRSH
jgi:hypothetical protein